MTKAKILDLHNIQAVLLDLDDTILNDNGLSEKTWRSACDKYAPLVGSLSGEELYAAVRQVTVSFWSDPENHRRGRLNLKAARRYIVSQAFANLGLENSRVAQDLADTFTAEKEQSITLMPGALKTLQYLKDCGLALGLITNGAGEMQRWKIEKFGLAPFFDCILIEGEFGAGKPDKSIFAAALERLKITPAESCMVGDDLERDILGAKSLGIFSIWVNSNGKKIPATSPVQPDRIIPNLASLLPGNEAGA